MKSFILLIFWSKFHIAAQERAATSDLTPSNCALCQCFPWFPPYKIALCQFSEDSILSFFFFFCPLFGNGLVWDCWSMYRISHEVQGKEELAWKPLWKKKNNNNPIGKWSIVLFLSVNSSYAVCLLAKQIQLMAFHFLRSALITCEICWTLLSSQLTLLLRLSHAVLLH